ncbi:MAG: hypothetical protein U0Y68_01755 [Blastocatellia bacterium]
MTIDFDLEGKTAAEAYRLLVNLVVPRPIALVTSLNPDGVVNAAPFSFFNLLGSDPPVVALGIGRDDGRTLIKGHRRKYFAQRRIRREFGQRTDCRSDEPVAPNSHRTSAKSKWRNSPLLPSARKSKSHALPNRPRSWNVVIIQRLKLAARACCSASLCICT